MARNDIDDSLLGIIQAKMDQSNGIDKGACAWCLFGPNGCPQDRRVGLQASCGRAHMGPIDRKPPFCIAACKTAGLEGPLYLNNKKFWTASLSGHSAAEAKPKAKPAGGTKGTPVPSEDDDDDDDDIDRIRRRRLGSGASRERRSSIARPKRSGAGDRRATALGERSVRPLGRVTRR